MAEKSSEKKTRTAKADVSFNGTVHACLSVYQLMTLKRVRPSQNWKPKAVIDLRL